jgi:hypothetical protein
VLASILAVVVIGPPMLLGAGVLRVGPPGPIDRQDEALGAAPSVALAASPSARPEPARPVQAVEARLSGSSTAGTPDATARPEATRTPPPDRDPGSPSPAPGGCAGGRDDGERTGSGRDDERDDGADRRHRDCGRAGHRGGRCEDDGEASRAGSERDDEDRDGSERHGCGEDRERDSD